MATITEYLKKYGKYTFLEKEFNEVDNAILSLLSYVNFETIVPGIKMGKITLKEASDIYFLRNTKNDIDSNMVSVKNAIYLFKDLASTNRFKDLLLCNYVYKVTFDMQFGALCILLPNKKMYISYEGTDNYISGWKEDCMLTYMFPTKAQEEAVRYINQVVGIFSPKIYVGGHSKGGNLAMVAAMYTKGRIRRKIKVIYNNDGPGLREKQFNSSEYKKISSKLKTYIPKSSVVGKLLLQEENYTVVDSKNKTFMQHDITSWMVEEDSFKRSEITEFSKKVEIGFQNWLTKMSDKQKEKFVVDLFTVLKKAEITDINEFKQTKLNSVIKIIKEMKNLDKDTRSMLLNCFKDLLGELK